ncbi:MAG TPA: acetylornithine deacetylase [Afifellaceae bacterium]|nr:acetylornithine deacetylase [Afifellaceae bacterium]
MSAGGIDAKLEQTRVLLGDLIGFATITEQSNMALIDYCAALLEPLGAKMEYSRSEDGGRANLFATFGPDGDGGLVLSGHTDVVPVEGQDWSTYPFKAVERNGAIYGRGACDMKAFLACCLAMAPDFAARKAGAPLHLAFTYDEEIGCMGAGVLLKALAESGRKPAACIIGEPTSLRVIDCHKGCHEYTTRFTGLEGHSSDPEKGVNAIEYAVRHAGELYRVAEELKERAPHNSPFSPPWSTLQVGKISGGIAHNVIARECDLVWDFRPVNDADTEFALGRIRAHEDGLRREMQAAFADADIHTETAGAIVGLEPATQSQARDIAIHLCGNSDTGAVSFGTEGGLYQKAGISTVICGPGSIEQAHKPDEFITLEQLGACLRMLERLTA